MKRKKWIHQDIFSTEGFKSALFASCDLFCWYSRKPPHQFLPLDHTRRVHWTWSRPACSPVSRSDGKRRHNCASGSWFCSRKETVQKGDQFRNDEPDFEKYSYIRSPCHRARTPASCQTFCRSVGLSRCRWVDGEPPPQIVSRSPRSHDYRVQAPKCVSLKIQIFNQNSENNVILCYFASCFVFFSWFKIIWKKE